MSAMFSFTESEIAAQRLVDSKYKEEKWLELEASLTEKFGEKISSEIVKAFRELYSLYSSEVMKWCAGLFDPVIGGYYYSNSGRDFDNVDYNGKNYKLRPDLESTYQADGFLRSSLLHTDVEERMPKWVGESIVKFIKPLQDKESGYFYHPQWDKDEILLSRRGRDIQWAVRLLERYGAKPTYDTPLGTKGDGLLADGSAADMNGAYTYLPEINPNVEQKKECVAPHLVDKESFEAYLATIEIDPEASGTSYKIGNHFESQGLEIVARDKALAARGADYSLADILKKWLDERYVPQTGCWAKCIDHGAVNGVLKICAAYNKIKKPIPDPLASMRAAISVITRDDLIPQHVCSVLNPWYAVSMILENVRCYQGDKAEKISESVLAVKREMINNYPAMIRATKNNISKFLKPDGSFSYYIGHTSFCSQGMPVAHEANDEGDLNATNICNFGIIGHIFSVLGVRPVPIFTEADRMEYIRVLEKNKYERMS